MKKFAILLIIAFVCFFIAGCEFDTIHYCPYCGKGDITEKSEGVYQCGNSSCGKTFGAKEIKAKE